MKNGLLLMTNKFPYGNQESFLETEIPFLIAAFDRVVICPVNYLPGDRECRRLSPKAEILIPPGKTRMNDMGNFFGLVKWYAKGAWLEKRGWPFLYHVFSYSAYLLREIYISRFLAGFLDKEKDFEWVGYSYWFLEGCFSISILRSRGYLKRAVSRAHGYDLYDFRQGGLIPFRNLKVSYLNKVAVISSEGCTYLKQRVQMVNKIYLSRLGTKSGGTGPFTVTTPYRIVSCSNVVPVKRVHLIAQVILGLQHPIEWIHFGDGEDLKKITEQTHDAHSNITVKLMGRLPNNDILSFYKTTEVHLFMNLSISEGLPVSIMEAISFGIPVIAMNVGGMAEIVNIKTGRLLPENASVTEIQQVVGSFLASQANGSAFRRGVRQFWSDHFDADKNYPEFVQNFLVSR